MSGARNISWGAPNHLGGAADLRHMDIAISSRTSAHGEGEIHIQYDHLGSALMRAHDRTEKPTCMDISISNRRLRMMEKPISHKGYPYRKVP